MHAHVHTHTHTHTHTFTSFLFPLIFQEVDMIVGDIAVTKEREVVMDFTYPFYYGYTTVILKRPDPNSFKWRKLVDPLKVSFTMAVDV